MTLRVGPTRDIAACARLRRAVFIDEQGVPERVEQDGRDGAAHHILAMLDGRPVGCARILTEGEIGKIGRLCVLPAWRGRGIGAALIGACLAHMRSLPGLTRAQLGAQAHALGLYEKQGFVAHGPEFRDAGGQPHRMMGRAL